MIKTPLYWDNEEIYGELVKVKTSKGNNVKIPKIFLNGQKTAEMTMKEAHKLGLDPTDGMEVLKETQPLSYDLERVFYEIYEED